MGILREDCSGSREKSQDTHRDLADDFLVGPGLGRVRVEAHEQVVIAHHRERADRGCEDSGKFLQSIFDPLFAVVGLFAEQERAADAATKTENPCIPAIPAVKYRRVERDSSVSRNQSKAKAR